MPSAPLPAGRSLLDLPDESAPPSSREARGAERHHSGEVLSAARDVLITAFSDEGRRLLDPFAPAAERNSRVIAALRAAVAEHRASSGPLATLSDDADTLLALFAATLGWGPAQRYLDDPLVNEVKINNRTILVQEAGRPFVVAPEQFESNAEVRGRAVQLASALGVRLDAAHPQETLPVDHGSRVHVTIHPRVAERDGALVCIRRGRRGAWDLGDTLRHGTLDAPVAELLRLLCRARCSFLIAGRTGSGKTGMLEALANSWPDTPHIITIEDHALEIGIRSGASWTRELVDTQRDPQAFGRAAREALRQTPGLLLPGETRGSEAGAILALALSGHAVITTLHARTAAEAVTRFAGYAAQPGAYMYEGRRDSALRDACAAFDVVIQLDSLESIGRRIVAEVALLDGTATQDGELRPATIPLALAAVTGEGDVRWETFACAEGGTLTWRDSVDRSPEPLRERLARLSGRHTGTTTWIAAAQSAVDRAERLLGAGEAERALSALREPWRERRNSRLLQVALRATELSPERFAAARVSALSTRVSLEHLIAKARWEEASALLSRILGEIDTAALAAPLEGWDQTEETVRQGLEREAAAAQACAAADAALGRGNHRAALDIVNAALPPDGALSLEVSCSLLQRREAALEGLLLSGDADSNAVRAVRERRLALERDQQPASFQRRR
ncbi:MAG: hypothetical protein RLZZ387_1613 [Chloroflexota bacterium]|jgi:Flp pilus assembly CpaF family ATPase